MSEPLFADDEARLITCQCGGTCYAPRPPDQALRCIACGSPMEIQPGGASLDIGVMTLVGWPVTYQ